MESTQLKLSESGLRMFLSFLDQKLCKSIQISKKGQKKTYFIPPTYTRLEWSPILSFLLFSRKKHDVIFHQKTHKTAGLQIEQKQTESVDFAEKNNKM